MTDTSDEGVSLYFPRGLVGYPGWRRFRLAWLREDDPVAVLQSDDEAKVWFYVTSPKRVLPSYSVTLDPTLHAALELAEDEEPGMLCILVVHEDPLAITANLLGPILYNRRNGLAYQVVLQDTTYSPRHPVVPSRNTAEPTPCSC